MPADPSATLDAVLRRRAAELPDHVAFRFLADGEHETEHWTYAALDLKARALAVRLAALGRPGDTVLLLYETGLEPLAAFYGCLSAGMIAVPAAPPRPRQPLAALAALAADAGAAVVLTSQALLARHAADPAVAHMRWLATDDLPPDAAAGWQLPAATVEDVAALLYTSGSTSTPKGVMLSHKTLWGPTFQLPEGLAPEWTLNGIGWMPLYHISGLNIALLPLRVGRGTEVRLPAELVTAQPLAWLRAISRYRALQAGGPNFLYQACLDRVTPAEREGLDLSLWLFAPCFSEPIRAETLEQFAAAYAPAGFQPWAFLPNYGLSEHPGVTVRANLRAPRITAFERAALEQNRVSPVPDGAADAAAVVRLVSNGPLSDGVSVRLVDPATETACPPGQVGEVWVAGPFSASGYWRRPAATAETFGARLADTGEGPFVRTGDLGFLYEDELYICGRLKDMLIIRGHNVYAQDIEAAATGAHPELGGAAAAFGVPAPGGGEQAVLYLEVRPDCAAPDVDAISAAVRRAVARALQIAVYAVVLVPAGGLPRTGPGKIPRYQVRQDFLAQQAAAGPNPS